MKEMMKLVEKGDSVTLALVYTRSLAIPDPQTWYKSASSETKLVCCSLMRLERPARSGVEMDALTTVSSLWNKI